MACVHEAAHDVIIVVVRRERFSMARESLESIYRRTRAPEATRAKRNSWAGAEPMRIGWGGIASLEACRPGGAVTRPGGPRS
jgi:hypothetical protein